MTDGGVAQSFEQQAWLTVSQEIETELLQGFSGKITLHCAAGVVLKYFVEEVRKPGQERRTAGPRDGEERRMK